MCICTNCENWPRQLMGIANRSNKVAGIEHEPWAEACFYLPSRCVSGCVHAPMMLCADRWSNLVILIVFPMWCDC